MDKMCIGGSYPNDEDAIVELTWCCMEAMRGTWLNVLKS